MCKEMGMLNEIENTLGTWECTRNLGMLMETECAVGIWECIRRLT